MRKVIKKVLLKDVGEFEAKIEDLDLDFSPIMWQHDRVYIPRNYKRGMNYPRLIMRTKMLSVDGSPVYSLILKRHIEDSGIDVVDEIVISDYMEAANIVHQLGFTKKNEVSRKRQEVVMDDDTMLYVDIVEGIEGVFAKMERAMREDDKVGEIERDLRRTFEALGENNFVENPYFEFEK